ncbi:MAG: translation initiation factor IF-2 N-terminal domain-containing protein, partial [Candidatus Omnitrophica bacterium]|nr:translation initiation factor IF-2 N-terminal domain-containing protein [Candidatus Omnitrophota bacterium]
MRVHELAKELGVSSKDLISQIRNLGQEVKTHMSVINEDVLPLIRKVHGHPAAAKAAEAARANAVEEKFTEAETQAAVKAEAARDKKFDSRPAAPGQTAVIEKSQPVVVPSGKIVVRFPLTVGSFAEVLKLRIPDVIKALMGIGVFANVNQLLNEEIGFKIAGVLGVPIEKAKDLVAEIFEKNNQSGDQTKMQVRAPVVTMMGHVDHGKTSLLDAIRKTNIAAREKGKITQHMGAYGVDIPGKGHVTFLDTPGHEAFTAMRTRGANVTDVVVLVVAADDGIMPQTVEAIDHAREANCPIVVAINKSDLPHANPQKVMMQLQKLELVPEEWGGKTICCKVSAKTGDGIEQLLELLLLEAEVLELKANPDALATGT